ncbi:uncharacterized WD repeat-containing protein C17D11.16-like [Malania oleifera]|uniref:uncharacterized WD repeat-containing protein C17D11.16-like n=1 Tax=Malania oleifera TaxID=397392 RepID=UPI0025AE17E1|nr:uncharacterized WD repeat-containing protein C17D11.16-like [Malania oleifera]
MQLSQKSKSTDFNSEGRKGTFLHTGFKWSVTADFESLAWDPHVEHSFVVSLGDGTVKGFDIRTATSEPTAESKPTFNLHAHDKVVCTVSYNPSVRNFLATGSQDKMVKLWDLSDNQPKCVASKNPEVGAVFSISFSEDSPFLLAMGGSKGRLEVSGNFGMSCFLCGIPPPFLESPDYLGRTSIRTDPNQDLDDQI